MSKRPGMFKTLLLVGALSSLFVAGAFWLAPGRNEQAAIEHREVLDHARQLMARGQATEAQRLLEPLMARGRPDLDVTRLLLASYLVTGEVDAHAHLVTGNNDVLNGLHAEDLHDIGQLYLQHDRRGDAIMVLEALAARNAANAEELAVLGHSRIDAGDWAGALAIARQLALKLRPNSQPAMASFVVNMLAHSGTHAEVDTFLAAWLGAKPDLASLLAVSASLVENGREDFVISALADRQEESRDARQMYVYALARGAKGGSDDLIELTDRLLVRLAAAEEGSVSFELALHDVLAFGNLETVADEMTVSGAWRSPAIRPSFLFALEKAGLIARLRNILVIEAQRPGIAADQQRSLARELSEMGFVTDAVSILKRAAASEGPKGAALGDLMYVWQTNALPVEVAWIGDQAKRSGAGDAEGWIKMIASASPKMALTQIERIEAGAQASARLTLIKARYLGWQGDSTALRDVLAVAASVPRAPAEYAELGSIACQIGDTEAAVRFTSLLGDERAGREVRMCASRLVVAAGREALARGDQAGASADFARARRLNNGWLSQSRDLQMAEALRSGTPIGKQRSLARGLADLGFTSDAVIILKRAAVSEGPEGAALSDLMYVWRSSGLPIDAGWIGDQARRSAELEMEAWIKTIASVDPRSALDQMERIEIGSPASARLMLLKARYLGWQGDSPALRTVISAAASVPRSQGDYAELGNIACQIGDAEAAVRLVPLVGGDRAGREIRRCAARLEVATGREALGRGEKARASAAFVKAKALDEEGLTSQDYLDFALATENRADAVQLFEAALERLPPSEPASIPVEMARATILSELKRYSEAKATLEKVLALAPSQSRARLQLAQIYLLENNYEEVLRLSQSVPGRDGRGADKVAL